jgi:hypothetical protein
MRASETGDFRVHRSMVIHMHVALEVSHEKARRAQQMFARALRSVHVYRSMVIHMHIDSQECYAQAHGRSRCLQGAAE